MIVGKPIRLTEHAKNYQKLRGFTPKEIETAVRTGSWAKSGGGRWETSKEFPFEAEWNGRVFPIKKVQPIFVEEAGEIVVITVYVYYY